MLERFGRIDVLINNAGGQFPSPAEQMTPKGWEAVIRNNLNGTFFMTREVATEVMIPAKRGRIVMVTAMVARGFPGMSHTGAARAGVENLTKSLSIEWAPHNIRVNCVAPGAVEGDRIDRVIAGQAQVRGIPVEAMRKAMIDRSPLRRMVTADDIVDATVFFASDMARSISGQVLAVNAGEPAG